MTPNGTIPGYIPPHLRGQVDSFKNEADGRISFRHDAGALGEFGEAGGRKFLTPEQYRMTFDRDYRRANLESSMEGQYGLERYPTNFSQDVNKWVGRKLRGGLEWGASSQGRSTGTAGLLAALAGGVGGTLMASRNGDEHPVRKGLMMALLAGATGAGVTAFAQDRSNRRDAMAKTAAISDETAYLRSVILGDPRLSSTDKAEILRGLVKMRDEDRDEMADKAQKLFGFGAGMYIARVLFSKGLIPSIIGGIIGATALSSGKSSTPKMNPWGQLSL